MKFGRHARLGILCAEAVNFIRRVRVQTPPPSQAHNIKMQKKKQHQPPSQERIDNDSQVGNIPTQEPVGSLTPLKARERLRFCLEKGGVIPSRHFRDELSNEELDIEDAWIVLREGSIRHPPEENLRTGDWIYRIEGREPDGKWLVIAFCFKEVDRALLVTVFSVKQVKRI